MADPRRPSDITDLEERVRALEKENAELSSAIEGRVRVQGSRWRAIASAFVIVVASLLLPVTIVAAWARIQLVDEDAFVQTLAPRRRSSSSKPRRRGDSRAWSRRR